MAAERATQVDEFGGLSLRRIRDRDRLRPVEADPATNPLPAQMISPRVQRDTMDPGADGVTRGTPHALDAARNGVLGEVESFARVAQPTRAGTQGIPPPVRPYAWRRTRPGPVEDRRGLGRELGGPGRNPDRPATTKAPAATVQAVPPPVAATMPPAASATPTAIPWSTSGTVVVTLAQAGQTIDLAVGQRLVLELGTTSQWTVRVDGSGVLTPASVPLQASQQGAWVAERAGTAQIQVIGNPFCPQVRPPCGMPSRAFTATVVVR